MPQPTENTVGDLYCGAGGSSTGAVMAGGEVVFALNHSPVSIQTHNQNHPDTAHLRVDAQKMTNDQIRRTPDSAILIASPSCFPAGSMVLAHRGIIPIEELTTKDQVFTHKGRWRRVTATVQRTTDTVIISGQGQSHLETTPDHLFLCRKRLDVWDNNIRQYRPTFEDHKWITATQTPGSYWCSVTNFGPHTEIPELTGRKLPFSEDFWWMIGRWIGDGYLNAKKQSPRPASKRQPHRLWPAPCSECGALARKHARYPHLATKFCSPRCKRANDTRLYTSTIEVNISCGHHEADELLEKLDFAPAPPGQISGHNQLRWYRVKRQTATVFGTSHTGLARWLGEHFGNGAANKTIPRWALTMPENWRRALLSGYVSADGHDNGRTVQAATISRRLAVGIRLLALSLDLKASLNTPIKHPTSIIEGRKVTVHPSYVIQWTVTPDPSKERTLSEGHLRWSRVRTVKPGRTAVQVFDISVEEDESFLVDGIVVHNCTNHSLAKGARTRKLKSTPLFDEHGNPSPHGEPLSEGVEERSRATMNEVCRFVEQKQLKGKPYLGVIVENVKDAFGWGLDGDGRYFKRWLNRIAKAGYEHEILFLNSMILPPEPGVPLVPQSRDRMYVVFWKHGIRRPDLSVEPPAWCVHCEKVVSGRQVFKRSDRPKWGSYGPQYFYVCPDCYETAIPAAAPAASIIDYSVPISRIGERERDLKPATRARIARGLKRLAEEPFAIRLRKDREPAPLTLPLVSLPENTAPEGMTIPVAGPTYESTPGNRDRSATQSPLATLSAAAERALVTPLVMANQQHAVPKDAATHAAQTIRTEGGLSLVTRTGHKSANGGLCRNGDASPAFGITSAGDLALIQADQMVMANRMNGVPKDAGCNPAQTVCTGDTLGIVELQRNGSVRHDTSPAHTVRSSGNHHGVLIANYNPGWARDAGQGPLGSVTTKDGHALVVPYSTKGRCPAAAREAAPTVTTIEKHSLVLPYYQTGRPSSTDEQPAPTVTTRDRLALIVPGVLSPEEALPEARPVTEAEIDACYFRMFTVAELARAQAIAYRADGTPFILEGTQADKKKMIGNACNPPVIRLILSRLLAVIDEAQT